MKKIGIISFFNKKNYGSVLQAYALHEYIKKIGYNPIYFNIKETGLLRYIYYIHAILDIIFHSIMHPSFLNNILVMRKTAKNNLKIHIKTQISISQFVEQNISYINISRYKLRQLNKDNEYLCFIVGSDQIWSPLPIVFNSYRFLTFSPRYQNISYAPSFGVNIIPNFSRTRIIKMLKNIEYLSIREQSSLEWISQNIRKDGVLCLDPTLMVDEEFWINSLKSANHTYNEQDYIVAYFLNQPNSFLLNEIEDFSLKFNCKVLYLPYTEETKIESSKYEIGPLEFVNLIKNANYIFTDSYHGTLFSIIFRKNFITFERNHRTELKQTSRIESILELLNLSEQFYSNSFFHSENRITIESLNVNYSNTNKVLNQFRMISSNFLVDSIADIILKKRVRNDINN